MIAVLEGLTGTMAILNGFMTIAFASVMIPIVFIIFRYAMKEKSYEERIAEQRKKLMEHNAKSKSKKPEKKSSKKVEKERSHTESKKKPVTSQQAKKSEALKSNSILPSMDKVDGASISSKKKNEKVSSKNSNHGSKSTLDDNEEKQRAANDDNNNQEKYAALGGELPESIINDDPNTSSASTSSGPENDVSSNSSGSQLERVVTNSISHAESTNDVGTENVVADDIPPAVQDDISGEIDKKSVLTDSGDKYSKKQHSKSESDSTNKFSQKIDEKTKNAKALKLKSDGEKNEPEKLASPSKKKRSYENSETGSDSGSCTGNISEESKLIQDIKEEDVNIGTELSVEKSPAVSSKKMNLLATGVTNAGKTSPKNQRQTNNAKNVKKQAPELKVLQKMTNENNGSVNVTLLIPLLAKAELSHSEIQNLIDLLLNKQQDSTIDAEWIGSGRQDPTVKLKKQVTEKEKALAAEQEAHQAVQNKVKELRVELNNERHTNRQREEAFNGLKAEIQTLTARFQAASEEKQNLAKQMQQLQTKLNEERMLSRSLKEEGAKTKSALQQELLTQRQQLEVHIAALNEQHQQTVLALEAQLSQVLPRLQEQENTNGELTNEIVLLRDRINVLETQITHYQQTHAATQELMIQVEESRNVRTMLERDLNNQQFEVNRLNNELRSLTEQLNRKNAEIEKFNCIVNNMKVENEELLKENARNNEQVSLDDNVVHENLGVGVQVSEEDDPLSEDEKEKVEDEELFEEDFGDDDEELEEDLCDDARKSDGDWEIINLSLKENAQLQKEYKELKDQFMAMRESNSSEQFQEMESAACRYRDELNEKTQELYRLQEHLAQLESSNKDTQLHDAELEEKKKTIDELNDKLNKQLDKNEDLRRKNWKAMEALSNMEKTLESKVKAIPSSPHDIKLKEREAFTEHIKKNLPNIRESNLKYPSSYEDDAWFSYLENIFSEMSRHLATESDSQLMSSLDESIVPTDKVPVLDKLQKQNKQLQIMVSRYKRIISETENMLNSLQNHIEQEESRWSDQVRSLNDQLKAMSDKVLHLQTQQMSLSGERDCSLDKIEKIQNGCVENEVNERKPTSCVDKCPPMMANSSINNVSS